MDTFLTIITQLVSFFIMLAAGYIAARFSVMSEKFLDGLSGLVMKVLLPIFIFSNAMNGTTRSDLFTSYPILILTFGMYAGLIIVFYLTAKILRLAGDKSHIFQAAFIFGNAGFIGIPLLTAIYPQQGPLYAVLMSLIDQPILWTYGIYLTTPRDETASFNWKKLVNPALAGVLLALILLLCGIKVPSIIETPLLSIGRASTPLSLIYLGGLLFYSSWKNVLREKEMYVGIAVKMLAFPLLFCWIAGILCGNMDMVRSMSIVSGLPTMATIAMFAKSRGGKYGDYALGLVLITTIVSLFTLAAVSWVIF